jgi:pimeloyl-ACP methyl ester carboxylesterase
MKKILLIVSIMIINLTIFSSEIIYKKGEFFIDIKDSKDYILNINNKKVELDENLYKVKEYDKLNSFNLIKLDKNSIISSEEFKYYIIDDYEKEHIIKYKDTELKLFKNSNIMGFKTIIKMQDNEIYINYYPDENANIDEVFIPLAIKNERLKNENFIKINSRVRLFNNLNYVNTKKYYPIISKELTKSDYYGIFPSILDIYDPVLLLKDIYTIQIIIDIKDTKKIEDYNELYKMKYKSNTLIIKRKEQPLNITLPFVTNSYREIDYSKQKNKKAIFFIHGLQPIYVDETINDLKTYPWRSYKRFETWNEWYRVFEKDLKKEYDYYEYIYDTHTKTYEEFGNDLYKELEKMNMKEYEEVYFISHSMGALVTLKALNNYEYKNIKKIIMLNGVNLGSPLQNVPQLFDSRLYEKTLKVDETIIKTFDILSKLSLSLIQKEKVDIEIYIKEVLEEYPIFFPALLTMNGILDPFKGGISIRFSNEEYIKNINKNLFKELDVLNYNENIIQLQKNNFYKDKTYYLFSDIKNFIDDPAFNFTYNSLKMMGEISQMDDQFIKNDGAVPVYSQKNGGEINVYSDFQDENLHHELVYKNEKIIKFVSNLINK